MCPLPRAPLASVVSTVCSQEGEEPESPAYREGGSGRPGGRETASLLAALNIRLGQSCNAVSSPPGTFPPYLILVSRWLLSPPAAMPRKGHHCTCPQNLRYGDLHTSTTATALDVQRPCRLSGVLGGRDSSEHGAKVGRSLHLTRIDITAVPACSLLRRHAACSPGSGHH